MVDPKEVSDAQESSESGNEAPDGKEQTANSEPTAPGKGGFGEFSEQYRARWAANHPQMRRTFPVGGTADPSTPSSATPAPEEQTAQPRRRPRKYS